MSPRLILSRLVPLALLLVPARLSAQTILNVERLQPQDVLGYHWGVEGEFGLDAGNTDAIELNSGLVLGHRRTSGHWLRVFGGVDLTDEEGAERETDLYLHLRYNHQLTERLKTFHFVQLQDNRTGWLRERWLVGSGLRLRVMDGVAKLDLGSGAMFEAEELDAGQFVGERLLDVFEEGDRVGEAVGEQRHRLARLEARRPLVRLDRPTRDTPWVVQLHRPIIARATGTTRTDPPG